MFTFEDEFDPEEHYLVITRGRKSGAFRSFRWYPNSKHTVDEIEALIAKHNDNHEHEIVHELVADKLAREICAYRRYAQPLEDLKEKARELQESIDKAEECLDDAQRMIGNIRGLD